MKVILKISDDNIDCWLKDEELFLRDLKDEPAERVLECAYLETLCKTQDLL